VRRLAAVSPPATGREAGGSEGPPADCEAGLTVGGREVAISNPRKVLFPGPGHPKLNLGHYYLAGAPGALRAAGGRPNVLVRYPDGLGGEFFYQKRAPVSRPPWVEVVSLRFPSGRQAEEVVPREPAALAWMANLACFELHPHPVRTEDLNHPDELRVDLDPVPGISWDQMREVARVVRAAVWDRPGQRPDDRDRARPELVHECLAARGVDLGGEHDPDDIALADVPGCCVRMRR